MAQLILDNLKDIWRLKRNIKDKANHVTLKLYNKVPLVNALKELYVRLFY